MKKIFIYFLFLIGIIFSSNGNAHVTSFEKCPHGCCQRYEDYEIRSIQKLLKKGLIKLHNTKLYISDPILTSNIYNEGDEIEYQFLGKEGKVTIELEIDDDEDEGDNNPYDIRLHKIRWSDGFEKSKEFALENYSDFVEFLNLFERSIYQTTKNSVYYIRDDIRQETAKLLQCLENKNYALEVWKHEVYEHSPYLTEYIAEYRYSEDKLVSYFEKNITQKESSILEIERNFRKKLELLETVESKIHKKYEHIYNWCIENHQFSGSFYNRGFYYYHLGNNHKALSDVKEFLKKSKNLLSQTFLLKGSLESELGRYNEAIKALSKAIKKDPSNKNAYFERAICYFELEDFDHAIEDYLSSSQVSKRIPINAIEILAFSNGVTKGIINGSLNEGKEFIPSILSSLQGPLGFCS